MNRNVALLLLAIVAFILGAVAAQAEGEVIFNALTWLGIGSALFVGAHLPNRL